MIADERAWEIGGFSDQVLGEGGGDKLFNVGMMLLSLKQTWKVQRFPPSNGVRD